MQISDITFVFDVTKNFPEANIYMFPVSVSKRLAISTKILHIYGRVLIVIEESKDPLFEFINMISKFNLYCSLAMCGQCILLTL